MRIGVLVFTIVFCVSGVCFSDELPSSESLFEMIMERQKSKNIFVDKVKIKKDLQGEFGLDEDGLAFVFSVRAARLSFDGFDFFQNVPDLMKLCSLYLEAVEAWSGPLMETKKITVQDSSNKRTEIVTDFYGFFPHFVSERTSIGEADSGKTAWFYSDFYQIDYARRRFSLMK